MPTELCFDRATECKRQHNSEVIFHRRVLMASSSKEQHEGKSRLLWPPNSLHYMVFYRRSIFEQTQSFQSNFDDRQQVFQSWRSTALDCSGKRVFRFRFWSFDFHPKVLADFDCPKWPKNICCFQDAFLEWFSNSSKNSAKLLEMIERFSDNLEFQQHRTENFQVLWQCCWFGRMLSMNFGFEFLVVLRWCCILSSFELLRLNQWFSTDISFGSLRHKERKSFPSVHRASCQRILTDSPRDNSFRTGCGWAHLLFLLVYVCFARSIVALLRSDVGDTHIYRKDKSPGKQLFLGCWSL